MALMRHNFAALGSKPAGPGRLACQAKSICNSPAPDPVLIATEGARWGSIAAHDFLCGAVVLSDDAGQFAVGAHALCWVHAERLVHKLETFTDQHRAAQQRVRGLIWDYYAALKPYQADPDPRRRPALRALRPHLPPPHRLRPSRPATGTAV